MWKREARGEGLDQQLVAPREDGPQALDLQPFGHLFGQAAPLLGIGEHTADAVGEEGGERELAAGVDRDLGFGAGRAGGTITSFSRMPS